MKKSITVKDISYDEIVSVYNTSHTPKAGDIALFEVIEIGKHTSIQGVNGNNAYLFPGDQFLAAFGSRYATEQFEGYVPSEPTQILDILGKGGVVGQLKTMHYKFKDIGTTKVRLIGYAVDEQKQIVNSIYFNKERIPFDPKSEYFKTKTILSLGGSMDSGKTTTAAYLSRALSKQNKKVAFIKLTGTYYTKDKHFVRDCGAATALDFGYSGYPSTFLLEKDELLDLYQFLVEKVSLENPNYIVVEIADGILQRETEMLINDPAFTSTIDHVIFSAVDSLSALYGMTQLTQIGLCPFALSGLFTASPLLVEEVVNRSPVPVLNLEELEELDLQLLESEKSSTIEKRRVA